MKSRMSPAWWPALAVASPVLVPLLAVRNRRFQTNRSRATERNRDRIAHAVPLEMPGLDTLELTVLVEWKAKPGFLGDSGVSYVLTSQLGSLTYDIGYGPATPTLSHNAAKLGFHTDQVDAVAISHLHGDHMGGMPAAQSRVITVPSELMPSHAKPCYLPDRGEASGFEAVQVEGPQMLAAGIASTGPLARSLFMLGYTEEQALLARVHGKGLVVITGCGHPTVEVILKMVGRLSDEPIYAIAGGLHFPITAGRGNRAGIQFQMMMGTGKPPWRRMTDADLDRTIETINAAGPQRVLLSGHDTCDHALGRLARELQAETEVLEAGATYRF